MVPLIITNHISIQATIAQVWDALINPHYTKQYMFGCEPITTWQVGSPLLWQGQHEGKEMVFVKGNVVEIIPEKYLAYTVIDPLNPAIPDVAENYLTVTYTLSTQNQATLLTITQGNYATVAEGEKRYQEAAAQGGWQSIIDHIKQLVEAQ